MQSYKTTALVLFLMCTNTALARTGKVCPGETQATANHIVLLRLEFKTTVSTMPTAYMNTDAAARVIVPSGRTVIIRDLNRREELKGTFYQTRHPLGKGNVVHPYMDDYTINLTLKKAGAGYKATPYTITRITNGDFGLIYNTATQSGYINNELAEYAYISLIDILLPQSWYPLVDFSSMLHLHDTANKPDISLPGGSSQVIYGIPAICNNNTFMGMKYEYCQATSKPFENAYPFDKVIYRKLSKTKGNNTIVLEEKLTNITIDYCANKALFNKPAGISFKPSNQAP